MPRPRSSSAATTSSRRRTSTRRSPGQRAARAPITGISRSARSGSCSGTGNVPGKDAPAWRAAEQVARQSYGKLVAFLAARSHDVAAAEDALADAFAAALAHWPADGIPSAPESWLLVTARRRMIATARRRRTRGQAADHLMLLAGE